MINYNSTSRSTWACELKCRSSSSSVSRPVVTLHVSVWVEISLRSTSRTRKKVTLHVSVWVEIFNASSTTIEGVSRSTWACELKCVYNDLGLSSLCHAPRERVSWNKELSMWVNKLMVTLHVSVWVEISIRAWVAFRVCGHAPRERVSWNPLH